MGYSTIYELSVIDEKDSAEELAAINVPSDRGNTSFQEYIESIYSSASFEDAVTWYDHEKDMKEVSKKFPHLLFKLKGEGDNAGDIWCKYFLAGKMQVCKAKITFEDFDKNKLK